jgi:hypothetical protein
MLVRYSGLPPVYGVVDVGVIDRARFKRMS